jgi:hypothetical protein
LDLLAFASLSTPYPALRHCTFAPFLANRAGTVVHSATRFKHADKCFPGNARRGNGTRTGDKGPQATPWGLPFSAHLTRGTRTLRSGGSRRVPVGTTKGCRGMAPHHRGTVAGQASGRDAARRVPPTATMLATAPTRVGADNDRAAPPYRDQASPPHPPWRSERQPGKRPESRRRPGFARA